MAQKTDRRIITTDVTEEDYSLEGSLRPQTLDEYIGQEKTKKTLKIYIEAAKQRGDSLDHVLFYGPPGLGKTTLAGIIANEMGVHMKVTSGPAIEKPGEMAAILNNLQEGDLLFVDEIHRLNRQVEEVLYPAMEDFAIDIMIGKGATARSIRLDLPQFTLVGATTRAGLLTAPLRDRFGVIHHLEFYTVEELKTIILRSAKVLGVTIDEGGAVELARRSRGTPRLANRLLKRVRDFAQVKYDGKINEEVAAFALDLLEVDKYGLDQVIHEAVEQNIPFLGICLGLQLLFESSEESPGVEGLGILKGKILRIPEQEGLKIPHMGWNSLKLENDGRLFRGIEGEPYVYFVHSYYLKAEEEEIVRAATTYSTYIHASVEKGNVFACQFHPEKSSTVGLKILKNFADLDKEAV